MVLGAPRQLLLRGAQGVSVQVVISRRVVAQAARLMLLQANAAAAVAPVATWGAVAMGVISRALVGQLAAAACSMGLGLFARK